MCSASFWETTQFWIVESRNPWVFKEKPFESSLDRRTHGFSFNTIEIHPDLHSRWRPWGGAAETAGWCGRWPTGRPVLFLVDMLEMDGHLKISWLLNNEVNHGKPNDEPSPLLPDSWNMLELEHLQTQHLFERSFCIFASWWHILYCQNCISFPCWFQHLSALTAASQVHFKILIFGARRALAGTFVRYIVQKCTDTHAQTTS